MLRVREPFRYLLSICVLRRKPLRRGDREQRELDTGLQSAIALASDRAK